jgi:2-dehydro-3-deoxyphosphogluconate aldolase/(4S)-4-hydroxy-2-oxoglutarate aldolase
MKSVRLKSLLRSKNLLAPRSESHHTPALSMSAEIFSRIAQLGIVPVIAIENADAAIPLADAFIEGGLPVVEITFRTAAAAEVIRKMARERPQLIVGAGTVLTLANLEAAKASGAAFAVAPGLNPQTVMQAQAMGLPFMPGVATPSDIELGLSLGCKLLKFFPAEANGGVNMIEALSAPYKHAGVRFMPTGGVNPANLESYLKLDTVAAVGGTWIAKKEDLAHGKWDDIRKRCKAALEIVAKARGKK